MATVPAAKPERNTVAGILAGLAPLAAVLYAFATLVVLCGGVSGVAHRVEGAGVFGFLILLMLPVVGLTLAPVLFLVAWRGTRFPAAVVLGLAVGPWMLGLVGTGFGMTRVNAAIRYADLSSHALLAMVGSGEAMASAALGAWASGALLCATGLGLAIAARARKAPDRVPLMALVALVALPAVVMPVLYAAEVSSLFLAVPSGLVVLVAIGLAGSAVGSDRESGAQASAASLACTLGLVATLLAIIGFVLTQALTSAGNADPSSRALFLSMSLAALVVGRTALLVIGGGATLGAIAIAGLSFVRARPTTGRLASGVVAVLVALLAFGADRLVFSSIESDAADASRRPWHEVEGFEPTLAEGDYAVEPHAVVTPEWVVPFRGDPVPMSDDDALVALFVSLRAETDPTWRPETGGMLEEPIAPEEEEPPEWLDTGEDPVPEGERDALDDIVSRSERRLGLALDARLNAAALRRIITLLVAAEVDIVTFVSGEPERISEEARALVAQAPLIEAFTTGRMYSTWVMLEHVLPGGYADADQILWHGEVNGDLLRIQHRVDAPVEDGRYPGGGVEIQLDVPSYERRAPRLPRDDVVYLTLGDTVTPGSLFGAAYAVEELDARPVLMLGQVPGHPERPLVPPTDVHTSEPIRSVLRIGALEEESGSGVFGPAIVLRSLRARQRAIQSCYEAQLREDPTLAGRVVVSFTILPRGTVSEAHATENTTGSEEVARCSVDTVRRLRFAPGPEGGPVTFAYPFVFSPQL